MFNSFIYKISNNLNAKFLFKGYMSKFKLQNCLWETSGKLVIGVIFISCPPTAQDSRLRKIHKTFIKGGEQKSNHHPSQQLNCGYQGFHDSHETAEKTSKDSTFAKALVL